MPTHGLLTRHFSGLDQTGEYEITPDYVPATITDVCADDCHILEVSITNVSDAPVTISIADKQDTPMPFLESVSIDPKTAFVINSRGRLMIGGITWLASASNALVAAVRVTR